MNPARFVSACSAHESPQPICPTFACEFLGKVSCFGVFGSMSFGQCDGVVHP
ncbi:hypothetical protein Hanom_Chr02g00103011 [Helianthus anomalus]